MAPSWYNICPYYVIMLSREDDYYKEFSKQIALLEADIIKI